MSHGATSSVAKLALESTSLPLLIVGCSISAGFVEGVVARLDLIRDAVACIRPDFSSSSTEVVDSLSGVGDIRRLLLDACPSMASYEGATLPEKVSEASLPDLEDVCE